MSISNKDLSVVLPVVAVVCCLDVGGLLELVVAVDGGFDEEEVFEVDVLVDELLTPGLTSFLASGWAVLAVPFEGLEVVPADLEGSVLTTIVLDLLVDEVLDALGLLIGILVAPGVADGTDLAVASFEAPEGIGFLTILSEVSLLDGLDELGTPMFSLDDRKSSTLIEVLGPVDEAGLVEVEICLTVVGSPDCACELEVAEDVAVVFLFSLFSQLSTILSMIGRKLSSILELTTLSVIELTALVM